MKLLSSLLFSLLFSIVFAYAQTGNLQVSGDSLQTITLTGGDLQALKHISLEAKGHDEIIHRYDGVLLSDVLTKAGVPLGEHGKKTTSASYVLVKAADNYSCLFALAEVDTLFTDKIILLADKQDGQALPSHAGPYQVIVPGEKKHARWIRQVVSLQVITAH